MPELLEANIGALLECIEANEKARAFYLNSYLYHMDDNICNSHGCLVGNHVLSKNLIANRSDKGLDFFGWAQKEYNLSKTMTLFIVASYNPMRTEFGIQFDGPPNFFALGEHRPYHDKEAAIKRVRKMCYYIMHKKEMICDPKYGVKESARRQEGNHNILKKVSLQVA